MLFILVLCCQLINKNALKNRLMLQALLMLSLYNFILPILLPNLWPVQFTLSDIKYDVIIITYALPSLLIN